MHSSIPLRPCVDASLTLIHYSGTVIATSAPRIAALVVKLATACALALARPPARPPLPVRLLPKKLLPLAKLHPLRVKLQPLVPQTQRRLRLQPLPPQERSPQLANAAP